ncbi:MAG TPA: hypothetical protein VGK41_05410 [Solirubrobacterales bacterium]
MGQRVEEVQLGKYTYQVVAQRHAYLERKLGPYAQEVTQLAAGDIAGLIRAGSTGYHGLLAIFIPELMPLHEWRGFASKKAYDETELWKQSKGTEGSDQYDEDADNSPDLDQMVTAFTAVAAVNRIDMVGKLKELLGPDFFSSDLWTALRAKFEVAALEAVMNLPTGGSDSERSPLPSGESGPTSGGTPAPTPAA